jgi:hypothetical protein
MDITNITILIAATSTDPIPVEVKNTDTVKEAKQKYYDKTKLTQFNQWIYDAEILEDDKTLKEYGISNKDTITANEASRGGLY